MVWAQLIVWAGIFLAGFGTGWQINGWRLESQLEALRAEHSLEVSRMHAAAERRAAQLQELADEARRGREAALAEVERRDAEIAALRVDVGRISATAGRLRRDLNTYAARARTDSLAACERRAAALADLAATGAELLAEGAGVVEEGRGLLQSCARDHDRVAATARTLLNGWPKEVGAPP